MDPEKSFPDPVSSHPADGNASNGQFGRRSSSVADGPSSPIATSTAQLPSQTPQPPVVSEATTKAVDNVLYSDIGVQTLLTRLKASIASANDFAGFLKKRSSIEETHAQGMKKLYRSTHESIHGPNVKQGSYLTQFDSVARIQDRMADNGMQFALSLHQMHEDLTELSANMERGRKQWKADGLLNEKKVQDAEAMMNKAKAKYDSLAEDLDRIKTGDKQGKVFGLKGVKSAAQQEEQLQTKLQAADSDYASKVTAAQHSRQELVSTLRPQAIRALMELLRECDAALSLQVQKYVAFNEKLLLGNGILVAPISGSDGEPEQQSMRDYAKAINHENDLTDYILSHTSKVPAKGPEITYVKHPVSEAPMSASARRRRTLSWGHIIDASKSIVQSTPMGQRRPSQSQATPPSFNAPHNAPQAQPISPAQAPSSYHVVNRTDSGPPPPAAHDSPYGGYNNQSYGQSPPSGPVQQPSTTSPYNAPPQLGNLQSGTSDFPQAGGFGAAGGALNSYSPSAGRGQMPGTMSSGGYMHEKNSSAPYGGPVAPHMGSSPPHHAGPPAPQYGNGPRGGGPAPPPLNPVFGLSLEELFQRDGTPVPMVVYQCIQAVDLFGLEVEGIYRIPGTASHIQQLKALFDNDSSKVDFRNPSSFHHDVNSVAGLLKSFFRDLRDPLFPSAQYTEFIDAARIDDDIVRRDSLHQIINNLPDSNYATLRALTLHLWRVSQRSEVNRMSASNLAICWAPTVLGQHRGSVGDAGLQARVLETVLGNTLQIFDED